jgi:hypothetical protein
MTVRPPTLERPVEEDAPASPELLFKEARQRRRRWAAGVCALAAALAVGLTWGVFGGGGNGGSGGSGSAAHHSAGNSRPGQAQSLQSSGSRPVTVDTAATPPGWVAVAFGDIEISEPTSWRWCAAEVSAEAAALYRVCSFSTAESGVNQLLTRQRRRQLSQS